VLNNSTETVCTMMGFCGQISGLGAVVTEAFVQSTEIYRGNILWKRVTQSCNSIAAFDSKA